MEAHDDVWTEFALDGSLADEPPKAQELREPPPTPAPPQIEQPIEPPATAVEPPPVVVALAEPAAAAVERELEPPAVKSNGKPEAKPSRGRSTRSIEEIKATILSRLNIASEAASLGVVFSASHPAAGGWQECFSIDRKGEKRPSAGVDVASGNGTLGDYKDFGPGGRSLSFFDLAMALDPSRFPDFTTALTHYAAVAGVELTKPKKSSKDKAPKPLLEQVQLYDDGLVAPLLGLQRWVEAKGGFTAQAVKAAGGRYGSWPTAARPETRQSVIAFFGFRPSDWKSPTALVMYRADGKDFPAIENGPRKRKIHGGGGSVDSLIVGGGPDKLAAAKTVWVCEGLTDALALSCRLPAGQIAVTNTSGAGEFAMELAPAFTGKRVLICLDCDRAGIDGAKLRASLLVPVAAEVRIVRLPFEVTESHGQDLRDFFKSGRTYDEIAALAAAAPTLTVEDAPPMPTRTAKGETHERLEARIRNVRYYVDPDSKSDKPSAMPLPMAAVLEKIKSETGDWPRRVNEDLFVHANNVISPVKKCAALFGYLQGTTGLVEWRTGDQYVTKDEVFAELQRVATSYASVEPYPHHPPIPNHYYAYGEVGEGDGQALDGLLDRFQPATPIDRDLMKAALMTLLWGGSPGARPVFVFTAERGRGKGKSKTASMIARVVGGTTDFSSKDDFETIKKRLLTSTTRVAFLDNVKSLKLSWAELEGLITAPTISGWKLYSGNNNRPNTVTWFITLNGAALSTDMAQRAVIIKIGEPTNAGNWEAETEAYIDTHRAAIIADLIACLKEPATPLPKYSRWANWEAGVLSRLPEPADAQKVILDRQGVVDVEAEEASVIEEYFAGQLDSLGYGPKDRVHIPSKVVAQWYEAATNEKRGVMGVGRILNQFCDEQRTKRLARNTSHDNGRGLIWIGAESTPFNGLSIDIEARLAERERQRRQREKEANWDTSGVNLGPNS